MKDQVFSERWNFIKQDLRKVGIGALIALGGALATYLQDTIPAIDFGQYQVFVVAINSIVISAIRKLINGTVYVK